MKEKQMFIESGKGSVTWISESRLATGCPVGMRLLTVRTVDTIANPNTHSMFSLSVSSSMLRPLV